MDNLNSIVSLYLKSETDSKKTVLNIKKLEEEIEFDFTMTDSDEEKTSLTIPFDDYRYNIINFINMYKQNLMVIDEKYNYDNTNNTCNYYVLFQSGRAISFDGFSVLETNSIRNVLYDIKINQQELRVNNIDEKKQMAYRPRLMLQQAGFTSYATLFLIALLLVIALIVILVLAK